MKEENVIHKKEEKQIIEMNRNDTTDKSMKIGIITIVYKFTMIGRYWDTLGRGKKDIKKSKIKLQEIKNIISEIKNTLQESNSKLDIPEENISEPDNTAIEATSSEIQRDHLTQGSGALENQGRNSRGLIYVLLGPPEEKQWRAEKYLNNDQTFFQIWLKR